MKNIIILIILFLFYILYNKYYFNKSNFIENFNNNKYIDIVEKKFNPSKYIINSYSVRELKENKYIEPDFLNEKNILFNENDSGSGENLNKIKENFYKNNKHIFNKYY